MTIYVSIALLATRATRTHPVTTRCLCLCLSVCLSCLSVCLFCPVLCRRCCQALQNHSLVVAARSLRTQIEAATGGYRSTMIRLVGALKALGRFHDTSRKLTDCDITVSEGVSGWVGE